MSNLNKFCIVLSLLMAFSSCRKETQLTILTGYGYKYWYFTPERYNDMRDSIVVEGDTFCIVSEGVILYFDKYGFCKKFDPDIRCFMSKKYKKVGDVLYPHKWSFVNDSLMTIWGDAYIIKEMTPEKMLLYDTLYKKTDTLKAIKRWYIPRKYRGYQTDE